MKPSRTKKCLIALSVILAIYGGAWAYVWWGPPKLRLVKQHDQAFAFANDVHALVASHSGRMPISWAELEQWQLEANGIIKWSKRGTSSRLQLVAPPIEVIDYVPQYIRVIDPDLKEMEDYINRRIDAATPDSKSSAAELSAKAYLPS